MNREVLFNLLHLVHGKKLPQCILNIRLTSTNYKTTCYMNSVVVALLSFENSDFMNRLMNMDGNKHCSFEGSSIDIKPGQKMFHEFVKNRLKVTAVTATGMQRNITLLMPEPKLPIGLKWKNVGDTAPSGTELGYAGRNHKLHDAIFNGKTEFSEKELLELNIPNTLKYGDFIKVRSSYYKPDAGDHYIPRGWYDIESDGGKHYLKVPPGYQDFPTDPHGYVNPNGGKIMLYANACCDAQTDELQIGDLQKTLLEVHTHLRTADYHFNTWPYSNIWNLLRPCTDMGIPSPVKIGNWGSADATYRALLKIVYGASYPELAIFEEWRLNAPDTFDNKLKQIVGANSRVRTIAVSVPAEVKCMPEFETSSIVGEISFDLLAITTGLNHYTSYIRRNSEWLHFDSQHGVTVMHDEPHIQKKNFNIFYWNRRQ